MTAAVVGFLPEQGPLGVQAERVGLHRLDGRHHGTVIDGRSARALTALA
jgi:hypothetical protein